MNFILFFCKHRIGFRIFFFAKLKHENIYGDPTLAEKTMELTGHLVEGFNINFIIIDRSNFSKSSQ